MHPIIPFWLGLCHRPRCGSLRRSPKSPSWNLGILLLREGRRGRKKEKKKGRKRKRREGRGGERRRAPNLHFWLRHWDRRTTSLFTRIMRRLY